MVKMNSLAACAICALLTANKSNHLVAEMQFFVDLETLLRYLEKSWPVRASDGEIHRQLWQNGSVDVVGMLVGVNELWMLRRRVASLWIKLN